MRLKTGLKGSGAPVVGLVFFFGGWELLVRALQIKAYVLVPPSRALRHIAHYPGFYWHNLRPTLWEAFLGFALALMVGSAVGAAMAHSRFIERAVLPIAVLIQVTPIVAYAAALVIWLGFGLRPIVAITTIVCVVPFMMNAMLGLRSVDRATLEVLKSLDASNVEIFFKLRVPHALPSMFAAARSAIGLALIGAVLGEFFGVGTEDGLGKVIKIALARPNQLLDQLWGAIFVLGFVGGVVVIALAALERRLLAWHSSTQF